MLYFNYNNAVMQTTQASVEARGGARIGWAKATWPFAYLTASMQEIRLKVTVVGEYHFLPDEVVAVEPYGMIPVLGKGIRIVHTKTEYPDLIVFWCIGSVDRIIERIRDTGFHPLASLHQRPMRSGIPFRWSAFLILLLPMWAAMYFDGFMPWNPDPKPGIWTLLFLAAINILLLALPQSDQLKALILNKGRTIGEVQASLRIVQLIVGLLFFLYLMFMLFGWPGR